MSTCIFVTPNFVIVLLVKWNSTSKHENDWRNDAINQRNLCSNKHNHGLSTFYKRMWSETSIQITLNHDIFELHYHDDVISMLHTIISTQKMTF